MKIHSEHLGVQEIDPESVIHFPRGLLGLEDQHDFKLFHEEGKSRVFWMQSLQDGAVSLSICAPDEFNVSYDLRLTDDECALLQLERPDEVAILLILDRAEGDGEPNQGELRANLNGPLIVNMVKQIGLQKVLVRPERHLLLRAID